MGIYWPELDEDLGIAGMLRGADPAARYRACSGLPRESIVLNCSDMHGRDKLGHDERILLHAQRDEAQLAFGVRHHSSTDFLPSFFNGIDALLDVGGDWRPLPGRPRR